MQSAGIHCLDQHAPAIAHIDRQAQTDTQSQTKTHTCIRRRVYACFARSDNKIKTDTQKDIATDSKCETNHLVDVTQASRSCQGADGARLPLFATAQGHAISGIPGTILYTIPVFRTGYRMVLGVPLCMWQISPCTFRYIPAGRAHLTKDYLLHEEGN